MVRLVDDVSGAVGLQPGAAQVVLVIVLYGAAAVLGDVQPVRVEVGPSALYLNSSRKFERRLNIAVILPDENPDAPQQLPRLRHNHSPRGLSLRRELLF